MKNCSLNVVIVGGGLAGLSAAYTLENLGHHPLLLEGSERLGGRVRTDRHGGYLLDVGFQVVLNSYPEVKKCLQHLELGKFSKGAYYYCGGWRLFDAYSFFTWNSKEFKGVAALAKSYLRKLQKKDFRGTTASFFRSLEVPDFAENFLTPFFRGIFLEKKLETPAARCLKLLSYFAFGSACLPANGMEAIPLWFASQLKKTKIRRNAKVAEASKDKVTLSSGEQIHADAVLLAVSRKELASLLPTAGTVSSCAVSCDYYSIPANVVKALPYLWLDGREDSPINNFCFLNAVQPTYAPKGVHLLSATSLSSPPPPEEQVRDYLCQELKLPSHCFTPLGRKIVAHALPLQSGDPYLKTRSINGCYIAGEAVDPPSINDALASGRKSALDLHHGRILP